VRRGCVAVDVGGVRQRADGPRLTHGIAVVGTEGVQLQYGSDVPFAITRMAGLDLALRLYEIFKIGTEVLRLSRHLGKIITKFRRGNIIGI
jgi:hypothetical protein